MRVSDLDDETQAVARANLRRHRLSGADAACGRQRPSVSVHLEPVAFAGGRTRGNDARRDRAALSRASKFRRPCRASSRSRCRRPASGASSCSRILIAHHLDGLFPGMRVRDAYLFRVTRDADLDLQEDEADDLLREIESELQRRRFGEPVRLETRARHARIFARFSAATALELTAVDCYDVDGLMALSDLWQIVNLPDYDHLREKPFMPAIPKRLIGVTDMFAAIREGDILLHHPYESFDPVVQFLQQAAEDEKVLAIKATLYRTSGKNSPITRALLEAAENEKQVAVVIELKARFDEENNIEWAQASGARRRPRRLRLRQSESARKIAAWWCAKTKTACVATCTSVPATTTRNRRASTPTSACSRAARNSGGDDHAAVQRADGIFENHRLRRAMGRAGHAAARAHLDDRTRNRAREGRPAGGHSRQTQPHQRR